MLFKGSIIAAASGKLAGNVFSHNKGGQYIRQFVVPTNPGSAFQSVVRGLVAQLASLWVDVLTTAQREAWQAYADGVPSVNALGDEITLTALNMYTRANVPRLQAGLARVDDAPVIFNRGEFTTPTFAVAAASDEVSVTFTNTDNWANEDDASMLVFSSRGKNQSINFFKGPYRLAGTIDGDAVTPPTSPAVIAMPFPATVGEKFFFRVNVSRADGRLSADFRGSAVAA